MTPYILIVLITSYSSFAGNNLTDIRSSISFQEFSNESACSNAKIQIQKFIPDKQILCLSKK